MRVQNSYTAPMEDSPTMTMAAFARLHKVTKRTVGIWRDRGLAVMTGDGLVDAAASNARLAARPATFRGGRIRGPSIAEPNPQRVAESLNEDAWTTAEAARRERVAIAKLRELEFAEKARLSVPIAEVCKAVAAEYAVVRAALLAMPSKLAHRLAAAKTPEECGALVDGEVRAALTALTADVEV
jgi:hypothetical protein